MNSDIYQHYRKEEAPFIDQVYSWLEQVESTYAPLISKFLTPREASIIEQIVNGQDEVKLILKGGYEGAERQRALLFPLYYQFEEADLQLAYLEVKFPVKFAEITHGKILGTLLGTGIERDRIGDIITDGNDWQIIVDATMVEYLKAQVDKIGNVGVRLIEITSADLLRSQEEWEVINVIASSLRLDTLLAKIYHISRQRAKEAIQAGLVKVNFMQMERTDVMIGEEDIVSLRRFGRFRIRAIEGMTKKENYRLSVEVLKV
ncbi:RNA-binding protein [Facklamia sp. DSM 111018]|uniref:RNA-binding protein n=1 Tax=Facklamia lactis TaxID=2749967 RepID=A0ABS0LNH2_9LACT|nr:YlmH/Sll1252 family protein [Facklamia lactis]MBG9979648.1 RNA-binding protein [Facklamia lactis]MBG9985672.1 RNA-binding protein [Facklamia lactis]